MSVFNACTNFYWMGLIKKSFDCPLIVRCFVFVCVAEIRKSPRICMLEGMNVPINKRLCDEKQFLWSFSFIHS